MAQFIEHQMAVQKVVGSNLRARQQDSGSLYKTEEKALPLLITSGKGLQFLVFSDKDDKP